MMFVTKLFSLILLASPLLAKKFGSINVDGYGEIFIVGGDGNEYNVNMVENGFSLTGGGGIHFAKEDRDDFSPDMYWAVS